MSDQTEFSKLIEGSYILQKVKLFISKLEGNKIENVKYASLIIMSLVATSLLGTMVFFLFNFLAFYSSLRCVLWLFECYNPENTSNKKHYIIETSAQDIIEYCIVPIFLRTILIPLSYLPIPFITPIIYFLCFMMSLITITDKNYRQKLCITVKYMFVDKNYVYGKEKELHKLLQILVYSFDCVTLYIVNIINNPKILFNKLDNAKTFDNAFHILTSRHLMTKNTININELNELSDGQLDEISDRQLDKISDGQLDKISDRQLDDLSDGQLDDEYD